jgi:hypothetical protein
MVESKTLRKFLDPRTIDTTAAKIGLEIPQRPPYGGLINRIPVLIIFLLGIILGGHHQHSVESTMMHKFVSPLPSIHRSKVNDHFTNLSC